jgi:hypothetical protein
MQNFIWNETIKSNKYERKIRNSVLGKGRLAPKFKKIISKI